MARIPFLSAAVLAAALALTAAPTLAQTDLPDPNAVAPAAELMSAAEATARVNQIRAVASATKTLAEAKCKVGAYGLPATEAAIADMQASYETLLLQDDFVAKISRAGAATKGAAIGLATAMPLMNDASEALRTPCNHPMVDMAAAYDGLTATAIGEARATAFMALTIAATRCALGESLTPEFDTLAWGWQERAEALLSGDFYAGVINSGNVEWSYAVGDALAEATQATALLGQTCPKSSSP